MDVRESPRFNKNQHCTYENQDGTDDYSFSHTAEYCGKPQPRFCGCPFDYPEDDHPSNAIEVSAADIKKIRESIEQISTLVSEFWSAKRSVKNQKLMHDVLAEASHIAFALDRMEQ